MMVSAEALAALAALEQGAQFNTTHTLARELMAASLAFEDFGRLQITEHGRVVLRRLQTHRTFLPTPSEMADLSQASVVDPMSNPMATPVTPLTEAQLITLTQLQVDVRATDVSEWRQRALKAAGVASGKTGEWPTPIWVEEFINAFDESR